MIREIWLSQVNRWHSNTTPALRNSGDNTQSHQCRVAQLLDLLNPDASKDLLRAALYHDNAEDVVGDVPRGKKTPQQEFREQEIMEIRGISIDLSVREQMWLNLCDSLDAVLWAGLNAPWLMDRQDWVEHTQDVIRMAEHLGVRAEVLKLLDGGVE